MSLTDYSSIFELFCAYNFVNAVNESDALKFLDFTTPIKQKVEDTIQRINNRIKPLIAQEHLQNISAEEKETRLETLFTWRNQANLVNDKTKKHNVLISNLYLIGGIFCFFMLLFGGLSENYRKLNSFVVLFLGTVFIYLLFLFCDHVKKNNKIKYFLVGLLSAIIIFLSSQQIGNFIPAIDRADNFYWMVSLSLTVLIILILFRKFIVQRKAFKSLVITSFILCFFIPDTAFAYTLCYKSHDAYYNSAIFNLVLFGITLALFPFLYDIIRNSLFNKKVSAIDSAVEIEYDKAYFDQKVSSVSDSDLDPIK